MDLAVDGQVDEILQLGLVEPAGDEAELQGRLLAALAEVTLVERESEFSVFQDEVVPGVVITAARNFPALDLRASGILRPELLVGDAGADAIAAARAEAD